MDWDDLDQVSSAYFALLSLYIQRPSPLYNFDFNFNKKVMRDFRMCCVSWEIHVSPNLDILFWVKEESNLERVHQDIRKWALAMRVKGSELIGKRSQLKFYPRSRILNFDHILGTVLRAQKILQYMYKWYESYEDSKPNRLILLKAI